MEHHRPQPARRDRCPDDRDRRRRVFARLPPGLFAQFHADETVISPRVSEITGYVLKRASSDLADILYSLDQGVGDPTLGSLGRGDVALLAHRAEHDRDRLRHGQGCGPAIHLRRVRAAAFPKAAGGTTLLRRYTTSAGTVPLSVPARLAYRRRGRWRSSRHGDVTSV